MRIAALALVSACALAACNPSAPSNTADNGGGGLFPNLTAASYRAEATLTNEDGRTMAIVMIRDGEKVRMEMGPSTLITNGESGESYIVSTQDGRTMAIRATGMGDQISNPTEEWQGELSQSATRTGSCSVAGENGAEWTKTTAEDGTDTVCVTDDGIILRATDDGRTVWETTSVQRGSQAASLFELPPGVEVMDLGNMNAIANEALERARGGN